MASYSSYQEFLDGKIPRAEVAGFEPISAPHTSLFPHQRDIALWACRGGRRAIFAAFGLGKTRTHLQVAKWIVEKALAEGTRKKYLIVAPLGVRHVFTREDGPEMGAEITYVRNDEEVAAAPTDIVITNYERVREGNITLDPEVFAGAGLDESSVLRSFGSKTYQTFLDIFQKIPYRFVFTATPSPNRHKELIHYGAFLGVMGSGETLTRFFARDSSQAGNLTLYPHMEEIFWLWLSSWAVFLQRPSDLGYSDEGYDLPPMHVHWHMVDVDHTKAWQMADSWGQSQLFLDQSSGLREVAAAKRETMFTRLQKARELIGDSPAAPAEAPKDKKWAGHMQTVAGLADITIPNIQRELKVGYQRARALFSHARPAALLSAPAPADDTELVIDAALHHVENQHVLRELLAGRSWGEAFGMGGGSFSRAIRWEGNAKGISISGHPQVSAIAPARILARARQYQRPAGKHWLLWHDLEAERHLIEDLLPEAKTVYGTQDLDEREDLILGFSRGAFPILATKPIIAGSGCNFQRHCSDAIFLGSTYKFNDFIQAVHRIYRFQQDKEVNIHVIYSESESPVVETLKAKWAQHNTLVAKMSEILRKNRLTLNDMKLHRSTTCDRSEVAGDRFRAIHNDCVQELATWPDNCVDQIVTSIPFGNQYEYSPSTLDFGHNPDNAAFFDQMDFLVPNLLRVLRPGRLACIHVKDRIRFGNVTGLGMPTVDPFSDDTVASFRKHGFAFMGRITIDTDVVRENNQTYRLGWTENCKDSSKMGVGMPEYVLLFRKLPTDLSTAYADVPVFKDKAAYTRAQWQIDAAAFWKSSGNRLPDPDFLTNIPHDAIGRLWKEHARTNNYDYAEHIEIGRELEARGKLPASYMLFPPLSAHPDIWTDILRMRVLNSEQQRRNEANHVCLARGSMVLTKEHGYIPIQNVAKGEHVLTHKGRWKQVSVVKMTGMKPVVTLTAHGVPGLTLTPDHKLWVRKSDWKRERDGASRTDPTWIAASETTGGYVNMKLPQEENHSGDETLWWTVGRWLADGHIDARGGAILSIGPAKWEHFTAKIGRFGGNTPRELTAKQILLRDKGSKLRGILSKCGVGADGKCLPAEAFTLPLDKARALLEGYLSGDGHFLASRQRWMASSVSRTLLLGIAVLIQRVFGAIPSVYAGRPVRTHTIEGRTVHAKQDWILCFDISPLRKKPFILEDGAWKKVSQIKEAGTAETWCLRVDEDESFTAEGCIVKNCPLQLDIVERLINRYSNPGDIVFDPFAGIGTVPFLAVKMGRAGWGTELSEEYWRCAVGYCEQAEAERDVPTLFDMPPEQAAA